jgi:prepilin-type N-terminal cleavage/methylation domain-containing protein
LKNNSGFTLIELVITMVITGILAGLFVNFFSIGANTFNLVSSSQDANQNFRIILERMGREVREAAKMSINSGTDFILVADIDEDGVYEYVRYFISGSDLHKTIDGSDDSVLLENIKVNFSGDTSRVTVYFYTSSNDVTLQIQTSFLRRPSLS